MDQDVCGASTTSSLRLMTPSIAIMATSFCKTKQNKRSIIKYNYVFLSFHCMACKRATELVMFSYNRWLSRLVASLLSTISIAANGRVLTSFRLLSALVGRGPPFALSEVRVVSDNAKGGPRPTSGARVCFSS